MQNGDWEGTSVGIRILACRRSADFTSQSGERGNDSAEKRPDANVARELTFVGGNSSQAEGGQTTDSIGLRTLDGLRLDQPAAKHSPGQTVQLTAAQEEESLRSPPSNPEQPVTPAPATVRSPTQALPEQLPAVPAERPEPKRAAGPAEPVPPSAAGSGKLQQAPERQPATWQLPRPPAVAAAEVYQSTEGIPLEDLLTYALAHHPLLKARHHEVEIAQARLITAGLLPNPQLVLDTETPTRTVDDTSLTTRLVFTIPLGNKRNLARRAAQAAIERAQHRLSRETETVLAAAAVGAVDVLYYQELARLRAQLAELAAWRAEVERARFALQAGSLADKMTAEVDAADARIQQLDAEARLEAARIRLAQLVGLTPPRAIAVQGRLAAPPMQTVPLEAVIAQALSVRPELAETRAAVQESQWRVALARASAIPDLDIGPRFQTDIGAWKDRVGARVGFDVPIFDRKQGDIAEQQALLRTNCALRDLSELNSLADVAAAYCELVPLRATLDYYEKEVLPDAQRAEEALLKAYEAKTIQPIELSDLQRKLGRLRLGYLEMRYRYNQLLVRLELFLGRKLSDLAQPQNPSLVPAK